MNNKLIRKIEITEDVESIYVNVEHQKSETDTTPTHTDEYKFTVDKFMELLKKNTEEVKTYPIETKTCYYCGRENAMYIGEDYKRRRFYVCKKHFKKVLKTTKKYKFL